jgi:hypothetical protein
MTKPDPHYHLTILGSARLKIKVLTELRGYTVGTWLKHNGLNCSPKKIEHPSDWRISYGVMHRFAVALGTTVEKLHKELTR